MYERDEMMWGGGGQLHGVGPYRGLEGVLLWKFENSHCELQHLQSF